MSSGCGDVLSLEDLKTAKKHQTFEAEVITGKAGGVSGGADIDYATNQVTGQVQKTLPAVLRDAGFSPAAFDFTTGGTLNANDRDKVVYDPVSMTWYSWSGALPKVIPAGTNPLADANWKPQTDPDLRSELASTTNPLLGDYLIGVNIVADGSVGRTVHDKFQEMVSVTDFGAVADSVDDQSTYLQNALTHGGYLYLPEGTYSIQSPLNFVSDTYLFGPGRIVSTNQTDAVLKISGVDNVVVRGITVSRSLQSNPGSSSLSCNILVDNAARVIVDGIKSFTSSIGTSVLVTSGASDVKVINGYYSTDGSYDASVLQTSSTVASPNAIFVDFAHDVLVNNNTCRNVGHGVMLQNVTGATNSYNITVTGNNIKGCSSYGIISYRSSSSIVDVIISGNTVGDIYGTFYNTATPSTPYTHGSGIYGQNVSNHTISDNIIYNVCVNTDNFGTLSPAGIGFGSVSGFTIANNVIATSGSNGIIIDGADSIVEGNIIKGCARAAIRSRSSSRVTIANNSIDCSSSNTQGVLTEDTASSGVHKYLSIVNNSIYSSVAGVAAVGLQNSIIAGNVIDSAGTPSGTGISVSGNASYDTDVINNKVTMSAGYGIRCTASARVIGNQVKGASSGQSITALPTGYFKNNTSDTSGVGSVFIEQNITAVPVMTPLWLSDTLCINVSGTTQINGIYNVPIGGTVTLRVPSGITIGNLVGSDGVRFRFADGGAKTTTRTQLFQFVHLLNGVLDCVSVF